MGIIARRFVERVAGTERQNAELGEELQAEDFDYLIEMALEDKLVADLGFRSYLELHYNGWRGDREKLSRIIEATRLSVVMDESAAGHSLHMSDYLISRGNVVWQVRAEIEWPRSRLQRAA